MSNTNDKSRPVPRQIIIKFHNRRYKKIFQTSSENQISQRSKDKKGNKLLNYLRILISNLEYCTQDSDYEISVRVEQRHFQTCKFSKDVPPIYSLSGSYYNLCSTKHENTSRERTHDIQVIGHLIEQQGEENIKNKGEDKILR